MMVELMDSEQAAGNKRFDEVQGVVFQMNAVVCLPMPWVLWTLQRRPTATY